MREPQAPLGTRSVALRVSQRRMQSSSFGYPLELNWGLCTGTAPSASAADLNAAAPRSRGSGRAAAELCTGTCAHESGRAFTGAGPRIWIWIWCGPTIWAHGGSARE